MSGVDWGRASRFEGPWASPGFRLWHRFTAWQRRQNAALRPHGLTQPQFSLLAVVAWMGQRDAEVSQRDIADFTGLERMHVSQVVRALEAKGLVERPVSKADARARAVAATGAGVRLLEAALPVVEAVDAELLGSEEG